MGLDTLALWVSLYAQCLGGQGCKKNCYPWYPGQLIDGKTNDMGNRDKKQVTSQYLVL